MATKLDFDRTEVPEKFYTTKNLFNEHKTKPGTVLAMTDAHFTAGWVTLGYVSKQTPFGQGTYLGFKVTELRTATPQEIRRALKKNHPHGADFRPHCREVMNASFHLAHSHTFGNWTNDKKDPRNSPVHDISRNEIREAAKRAKLKHMLMMDNWEQITTKQTAAILKTLS